MTAILIFVGVLSFVGFAAGSEMPPKADEVALWIFSARDVNEAFREYVPRYGRAYRHGTREFEERRAIFHERLSLIANQNSNPKRLWTAGINGLTDRTEEELRQLRGWRRTGHHGRTNNAFVATSVVTSRSLLATVDWRNLSMASDVPDQGGCGSCWAVATASMLQARFESSGRGHRDFSAQQLVDCVPNPRACGGTGGCGGATVELALTYVETSGLATLSEIPYSGVESHCTRPSPVSHSSAVSFLSQRHRTPEALRLRLAGWEKLPENEALPLMVAVNTGAVAVSVAASGWSWYSNGIFSGCEKDAVIDHAVVLFGYGKGKDGNERDVNFWLVRNSWGAGWGEAGFIRLLRMDTPAEEQAFCGIDRKPADGVACQPYPDEVRVCGMCGILYDSVVARF
eukprot:TRINITY_DN1181_c0_g1_i1.p1 TRINITY_DN1181_c0_g1~~TRINITY_DN1181_c0_g1_i1.p1  ORF type:complete len:400 (-),score=49.70 TRINITY_DN1181_c0_g1_i1:218-1417(-)